MKTRENPVPKGHNRWKHGYSHTPTFTSWIGMIGRCTNPRLDKFKHYGGRGITVCERWMTFSRFLEDMGERPPKTSLERRDNNGGYCKDNCRWATQKEQSNNRRTNRTLMFNGQEHTVTEWAEICGIPVGTLFQRLRHWPVEKALTQPLRPY